MGFIKAQEARIQVGWARTYLPRHLEIAVYMLDDVRASVNGLLRF